MPARLETQNPPPLFDQASNGEQAIQTETAISAIPESTESDSLPNHIPAVSENASNDISQLIVRSSNPRLQVSGTCDRSPERRALLVRTTFEPELANALIL